MPDADAPTLPELKLFGAPRIVQDGAALPLAIRKLWMLLAVLAIEGRATRSRLAGLLWAELDEAAARRNLRRELHRLREAGLAALVTGDTSAVELGPCRCDLHGFAQALDDGRLDQALAEYSGPLLHGIDSGEGELDDWLRAQRDRLHQRWHHAARAQAAALEAAGAPAQALASVLRVLDVDGLQEADYRSAMRLHEQLGEREAALALYERCRRGLGRELGLRPMAQTVALAERIRRGDPASGEPSGPVPSASAALPAPLVGREAELAALGQAVAQRPQVLLLVCGPAGIGKSRLAAEFAQTQGPATLWAVRPDDAEHSFAAPMRWLRGQGAAAAALPAPLRRELGLLLPELTPPGPPPDSQAGRDRLFNALAQAFERVFGAGLKVIDDLQWLDDDSFDWLLWWRRQAGATGTAGKMLWLVRDEELVRERAAVLREHVGAADRITLAPLTAAATLSLVRRLSGTAQGQRFAQRLHETTGGHPLFLLETLRHLLDSRWLQADAEGHWHTAVDDHRLDFAALPVPASVREAVLVRIDRLGEGPRRLLEAASCVRGPVHYAAIARATALSEWEAVAAFEQVLGARLMVTGGEGGYRFAHDLVAQTLSAALGTERRRLIHRALAHAGEQSRGEVADIAHHWTAGGDAAAAAPWWARAAQDAEDHGAPGDALAFASRAIEAGLAPAARAEVQLQRARLLRQRAEASTAALDDADAAARACADLTLLARVQLARAAEQALSDPAGAQQLVDAVLAQPGLPALQRSRAHQQRAALARQRGALDDCIAECELALSALPPGQWRSRGGIKMLHAMALMFSARGAEADPQFMAAEAAYAQIGDDRGRVRALCARASIASDQGDQRRSRALCEQALALAQPTQDVGLQRNALLNLLRALLAQGEAALALQRVEQALALSPQFSSRSEEQALMEAHFAVSLRAGELGSALAALPSLLATSRGTGELYRCVSGLLAPVDALLQLDGQQALAAALIDEAQQRLAGTQLDHLQLLASTLAGQIAFDRGDIDAAFAAADAALASPALREQDRPLVLRLRARAHLARGDLLAAAADLASDLSAVNPEQATLNWAARLDVQPSAAPAAQAWLLGGSAPPLESLTLALALRRVQACSAPALTAASSKARRLAASLTALPEVQAAFRRQFAALLE